ncbi:hypothetical protein [Gordoniibacillus kamchatkensis]
MTIKLDPASASPQDWLELKNEIRSKAAELGIDKIGLLPRILLSS